MTIDDQVVDDVLEHFGVKGMHWGSRKEHDSNSLESHVKRDVKEHIQASRMTGKGSGIRKRAIKQTVDEKSETMPGYKEAFHKKLANRQKAEKYAEIGLAGASVLGGAAILADQHRGALRNLKNADKLSREAKGDFSKSEMTPALFNKVKWEEERAFKVRQERSAVYRHNQSPENERRLKRAVESHQRAQAKSKAFHEEALKRIEAIKKTQAKNAPQETKERLVAEVLKSKSKPKP